MKRALVLTALLVMSIAPTLSSRNTVHAQSPSVDIDWRMTDRWEPLGRGDLAPARYDVAITLTDSRGCDPNGVEWTSSTSDRRLFAILPPPVTTPSCTVTLSYPAEGVFEIQAKLRSRNERWTRSIVVQDFLIAVLGDSNASGEGNPNADGKFDNPDCHRSAKSGHAQASRRIENDNDATTRNDERSSVTFIHLACSGASIGRGGLLNEYRGMDEDDGIVQKPQADELVRLAAGREIDAILMSAGVNDLGDEGFGSIIKTCLKVPVISCEIAAAGSEVDRNMNKIPLLYNTLAAKFSEKTLPLNRTFVTEYPKLGEDSSGSTCEVSGELERIRNPEFSFWANTEELAKFYVTTLAGSPLSRTFRLSQSELAWLDVSSSLLSLEIRKSASKHGMTYVGGIGSRFAKRGYCVRTGFIRTLSESFLLQANLNGAFHPNATGHVQTRQQIQPLLEKALFPNNLPRSPAGFNITFADTVQLPSANPTTTTARPKPPIVSSTTSSVPSTTTPTTTSSSTTLATTTTIAGTTTTTSLLSTPSSGCPGPFNSRTPFELDAVVKPMDAYAPFTNAKGVRPRITSLVTFPYSAYPLSELMYPNIVIDNYTVSIDGINVPPSDAYGAIAFEPQRTWGAAIDTGNVWPELYIVGYGGALPKRVVVNNAPGCGTTTLIYRIPQRVTSP
jgi:hypothetical protein